ncbi:MAG: adenylate/guanylate cyclase domain-containing protein [Thermoleophilia bacterium]|nr:adenylate/guanylate cyclase domain-containing protein [Thermoleophilia bacterium]
MKWKVPDVSYARSGDVAIAYQVVGEGPEDLVFLPFLANIYTLWLLRPMGEFLRKLAERRRLIVVNPRGVGLSDRPRGFTVESRMDDLLAVLEAVGSDRPAVLGVGEAAATCAVFAASYPESVSRLLLFAPYARGAASEEERQQGLERIRRERDRWGERGQLEEMARRLNPQWADDPEYLEWFVWHHRLTSSPGAMTEFRRMQLELDLTDVLPAIRVPTLVLATEQLATESAEVAGLVPGAVLLQLPQQGMNIGTEFAREAIEDFLSGVAPRNIPDTVLSTVLFTDIVGSTERAAELGDRSWRELLERHNELVRRELQRYRGVELDTAGDGFFASFDGPARAISCARAIAEEVPALDLQVRAGIHTGECERVGEKLAGLAVNVGARVAAAAQAGEVLVTGTVRDLVAGSGITFEARGERELKGIPGTWPIYAVSCD